ncbi:MAG: diguanylate cyclase [Rhodoferax sp.]|nr:diguanylate cyclase [Rhodoferax sp.]
MKLFVSNDDLAVLEAQLAALHGAAQLSARVELAWHLRQRDGTRALTLVEQCQTELESADMSEVEQRRLSARLDLIRSEVALLLANAPQALQHLQRATDRFDPLCDLVGQGDAYWLRASIALDRGPPELLDASLQAALDHYRGADDSARVELCQARRLIYASFRDPVAALSVLQRQFPEARTYSTALTTLLAAARGNAALLTNDPAASVGYYLASYHAGLGSGQLRQGLVSVTNAVESLAALGDLDTAMALSETALSQARATGWPSVIGLSLYQLGDVMRLLARYDEARGYLLESLEMMRAVAGTRNYEQVVGCLGQLALDQGDATQALDWFSEFEQHVSGHGEPDSLIKALRGQASALMSLGRSVQACAKAQAALVLARQSGQVDGQIQALRVLAQVDSALAEAGQSEAASTALEHLRHALKLAAGVSGYAPSPDFLNELAAANALCGDFQAAYAQRLAAEAAVTKMRSQDAQKRAWSLQIRQQLDHAKAETEHHRQLAESLAQTTATLETLGTIGREITASLDAQAVFGALRRHVHELLDASFFAIYLLDAQGDTLTLAIGVELGVELGPRSVALSHPSSKIALCARTRQEQVFDLQPGVDDPNRIPGTLATLSLLYAPLMLADRLLGVMTIQSPTARAYGARERSIFRTLCAYGAIALDNAAAYAAAGAAQQRADAALQELRQAQTLLIGQNQQLERLAVTDQLTGLFNRLRLDQTLEQERVRSERYGTHFCVLLLDVDHFKSVNDRYGHQMGDQVLTGIARLLGEHTREVDVVGRWGGEEFLIICTETLEPAMQLAEKLRRAVQSHVFALVGQKSASIGVAMFRAGEAVSDTLARADGALYRAKESGRNRVVAELAPSAGVASV